ncbi:MAG TPA: putative baseplate assembly protein [Dissulfurispiraceae bacterium]|nr:putative baseplate assembly protein [Dissulfurispiraceae bacterium]
MGLPIPKLSDKTFDDIANEARSLINRYAPEWTDYNLHDPGITFMELFAWLSEMQMYYLDRLTESHYRKFLKMAGFSQRGQVPAQVAVTFSDVSAETSVPLNTQIIALVGSDQVPFETAKLINLISARLDSIKTISSGKTTDRTDANSRDGIIFPAFGEPQSTGSALQLGFNKALPAVEISLAIFLFEADLSPVGSHGEEEPQVTQSVEVVWEYLSGGIWLPLVVKDDRTQALIGSGRVIFDGPAAMDKMDGLFWIRCRLAGGAYEVAPLIDKILINTVTAVQIETIRYEAIGSGDGRPGQKKKISKPPIFQESQVIEISQNGGPWKIWQCIDDFEDSGPKDNHYIVDTATGEILFGNGLNGSVPASTDRIRVSYRTTLGSKGNILKGQRFIITTPGYPGISISNQRNAEGGMDLESMKSATERAKRDLSVRYRAITAADFESVALSTPGLRVARAKAVPNYNPRYPCVVNFPNWMTVAIMPVTRSVPAPQPGSGFIDTVARHLDLHRLVTTGVSVVSPKYVKISVSCTVKIVRRSSPAKVTSAVVSALNAFLNPLSGGPDGSGWPFGRAVYPSEIYQAVDAVEEVDYVTGVSIIAEGEYQEVDGIIRISPVSLVYSGTHKISASE